MGIIVMKGGGTSFADSRAVKKSIRTLLADPRRRYLVPSAPGRIGDLPKVTDDLRSLLSASRPKQQKILARIRERFEEIREGLGIDFDLTPYMNELSSLAEHGLQSTRPEYVESRGEHLIATMLARALGWPFVEDLIRFDAAGKYDASATLSIMKRRALPERAVVASYYGFDPSGGVRVFSRGGGDISGAIVAALVGAELYENRTDVPGILAIEPGRVINPKVVRSLTFEEAGELAYRGARVLHHEAVFPVRNAGIPIRVCRYDVPGDKGTLIVPDGSVEHAPGIVALAGKDGFSLLRFVRPLMGQDVGFVGRLATALAECGIGVEMIADGVDGVSVVVEHRLFRPHRREVERRIKELCGPVRLEVLTDLAVVCVVGHHLDTHQARLARAQEALDRENISVRAETFGMPTSKRFVVNADQMDAAQRAIYERCIA